MGTDAILVQQTLSGDTYAFNQLVKKYQEEVFAISLSVVKNPEDAKDIVQETFLQTYLNLQQLRNPDSFATWLKKIAWNQSKKWYRQHGTGESVPLESADQEQSEETPVDEKLVQEELFQAVLEAIDALPVKEQQVIMAYLDGKSYDEIGRQHGLSYKGATNRVYRAREKILRRIQKLMHLIFPFGKLRLLLVTKGEGIMKTALTTKILITLGCAMIVGFAGYGIIRSTTSDNPDSNVQAVTGEPDETAISSQTSPDKRDLVSRREITPWMSEKRVIWIG